MREKLLVFGAPYWDEEMIREVSDCIRSGWWQNGPRSQKLEILVKSYTASPNAVAVNSCSSGLHLALLAIGAKAGDEVITTPVTWATTASSILHVGAVPIFADVNPKTGNIDPESIRKKITSKTRAILIVHLAGRPCEMDKILGIAREHELLLVEDAAHAYGAFWGGKPCGTFGDIGVFSFNRAKNVAAAEGGVVVTENERWAHRIRRFANGGVDASSFDRFAGKAVSYGVIEAGFNMKMPDIMAAMILPQLGRFGVLQKRREELWTLYDSMLEGSPFLRPLATSGDMVHARHLYQIQVPDGMDRDGFCKALKAMNIGTGVHYRPLHREPLYQSDERLAGAESFGARTISLPLSAAVSDDDVADVTSALLKLA